MPIYLCQPGTSSSEPWRHGIQVYERPFPLFQQDYNNNNNNASSATTNRNKKEESRREGPEQVVVVINPSSSSSSSDDHDQQASLDEKLAALKRYLTEYIVNPDSTTTRSANATGYTKHRAIMFCSNGTSGRIVFELIRQGGLATLQSKNTVLALESADNTNVYNKIDEFKLESRNFVGGDRSCNILVVEDDSGKL